MQPAPLLSPPSLSNYGESCFLSGLVWSFWSLQCQDENFFRTTDDKDETGLLRLMSNLGNDTYKRFVNRIREIRDFSCGQQDSQEVLSYIIDNLPSDIKNKFRFISNKTLICYALSSLYARVRPPSENFLLSLPIPARPGVSQSVSLDQLMWDYLKEESLGADWQLSEGERCDEIDSSQQWHFRQFNQVLVIQLLRYGYDSEGRIFKINTPIDVSKTLDLGQYLTHAKTDLYQLCACILHRGSEVRRGHYTAVIRCENRWYHCDDLATDSKVRMLNEGKAMELAQQAYLLFYKRGEAIPLSDEDIESISSSDEDDSTILSSISSEEDAIIRQLMDMGLDGINLILDLSQKGDRTRQWLIDQMRRIVPLELYPTPKDRENLLLKVRERLGAR